MRGVDELARAFETGAASPVTAVEDCLAAMERLDGTLGAWQDVYADEALAAAVAADAAIAAGQRIGPFHGIPFALKDIVDVEGRVTTGGSAVWRDRVSPATATIARRLLAAGGVLVGKTKTVEIALGGWGTNQRMGTPWNPWDADVARTPGGSSCGSGVAVSSGMIPCAIGTDTGGSVRLPAAFCGIVGLKTTEGLLPTDGIIPLSHTLDTPGPMTRSVADAALMFDVLTGRSPVDIDDEWRSGRGLYGTIAMPVDRLRFGCLGERERADVDADVLERYDDAVDQLRRQGVDVVPFDPPLPFEEMKVATFVIVTAEAYFHHGAVFEDPDAPVDEDVRARILPGRDISSREYIDAVQRRVRDRAAFLDALSGLDGFLTPTVTTPPLPLAEADQRSTPAQLTRAGNYLALCGVSVPAGMLAGMLPAALQIMVRGNDEALALRVAAAYERARGPMPEPPLS